MADGQVAGGCSPGGQLPLWKHTSPLSCLPIPKGSPLRWHAVPLVALSSTAASSAHAIATSQHPLLTTIAKLLSCLQALANGDMETLASVVDSACAAITRRIAGVATESAASINQATVQLQMLQLLGEACACPSTPLLDPPSGEGFSHVPARW